MQIESSRVYLHKIFTLITNQFEIEFLNIMFSKNEEFVNERTMENYKTGTY